ncbi:hypothetical protein HYPBUDRAFT_196546 [Hyphopichia burtonii NRRL Y-1933]|uniref:Succinate dehydrogenase [ubiquinone] cytochrome b small subunit n=1 Tax=Hyphopichia burtonii NRRL Y-1933 TaxID=984485 RepID=A0A1E4RJZ8_9ASCO|nr:hypothetical protein HYPBUDRAFT_196546 [Hyphopichia burtonii NRRL Y-1933]ODV67550.1 hypothetical protein HYPBUDRAFT_196546 [Hyphopichia burtonii NRRL Y-1933]
MFLSVRSGASMSTGIIRRALLQQPIHARRLISLKPDFSKLKKIEQPPGFIVDTVNEPYKPPQSDPYEGSYHWAYERMVSTALVPLLMVPFIGGVNHPIIDATFCVTLLVHCQSGFKACIIDYIPKRVYGIWHGVACKLLSLGTFVGLYGIYLLETTSNGLFDLIASLWGA